MELFRQEALRAGKSEGFGRPSIVLPVSRNRTLIATLTLVAALVLWAALGTYTRRVHVTGQLVPAEGLAVVAAKADGALVETLVAEGAHVTKGQPLASVSSDRSSKRMGATAESAARRLKDDEVRIEQDMRTAKVLSEDQAISLREQMASARRESSHVEQQIAIQRRQVSLQHAMVERIQPLLKQGYVSVLQVQQQQATLLSEQLAVQDLERQREAIVGRIASIDAEMSKLPGELQEKESELGAKRSSVMQSLAQAELERSTQLIAPMDGTVASVLVKSGQSLRQGQTAITIVPEKSPLVAQLLVDSGAIGFLRQGSKVVLHVQAYPYQKFGSIVGSIIRIPDSALSPDDAMALLGQPQVDQEPLYRIDVALQSQSILAYGKEHAFRSGMTVDADVLLDRRRVIEWFFEPLIGVRKGWGEE
ncbi:HlyD family efflux transporter periplasmic adaptor subunit [Luteibacter aegosomatis]|uniref:HlyD family efflux transporter periplasmic adaptor subunit n=1 Tax=Luteibacter aegosomatis TaxID=2911537 RepID=UPI001FFA9AE7|nr:HlyD family efflux transporter periplasmic adaptor subunit [Luteibacter aegosomatis]UPG85443.1 HlyD family efflux transporter periplasmic adaptor subunit [Luteibacter aegosomatis]